MTPEDQIALKIGRDFLQILRLETLLQNAQAELEKQTAELKSLRLPVAKGRKR